VNIIGNPLGLWSTITSSMQEVIERPRNEYTNGPLVYFEDAGYVLKKTGMGLCDSVN
jgi:hypothetical protein